MAVVRQAHSFSQMTSVTVWSLLTCGSMSLLVLVSATLKACSQESLAFVTVLENMHFKVTKHPFADGSNLADAV